MDPIADFLTQIRNGYLAKHKEVTVPHSIIKHSLAKILAEQGYTGPVTVSGKVPNKTLSFPLIYDQDMPVLSHISRISKPSIRTYAKANKVPPVLSGKGISILSTSKGLMTNIKAKKQGLGGEIICQIW